MSGLENRTVRIVQVHSFHLPVGPVKETADWILDHSDSGLVKRMDLGKSTFCSVSEALLVHANYFSEK